uniref:Uncharacterized protein n=1 Tax=Acrobeloides nanus TaxID=290746 RepID=A0A914C6V9_9BILA
MYILWQKLKIHRMKAICGESCPSPPISNGQRPYLGKITNQMIFSSLDQVSPRRSITGSVTPPPPARSFSGQLSVTSLTKVAPTERRLNKVNSQIILFAGQPYVPLYEETNQRRSAKC